MLNIQALIEQSTEHDEGARVEYYGGRWRTISLLSGSGLGGRERSKEQGGGSGAIANSKADNVDVDGDGDGDGAAGDDGGGGDRERLVDFYLVSWAASNGQVGTIVRTLGE